MKTLLRIELSLLMVMMLAGAHKPATAQTTATPRQLMKPAETPTIKPARAAAILRPNAVDDAEVTDPGTSLTITVLSNDTDPQNLPLTVVAVGTPANGAATTNGTTVLYTPTAGFSGIDTFTYTISNGELTNSATIDAIVLPPPGLIWQDDVFDPLALGPLNGQDGWTIVSGNASPVVITDPDPNRGKTVQIDAAPGQPIIVTKDVPDQNSGRQGFSFLVKVSGTTHLPCEAAIEIQTDPSTGWSNKARFCIGPSIAVNFSPSGADTTIVSSTVPEQWYLIHGEIDLNTNLLDVFVDGQLKVSGIPVHPGPIRALGITGQDQGGAGVVFVDDLIGVSSYAIAGVGVGTGTPGRPVYWINSAGGLWSNPANWSTRRVPTAADHAIITLGGDYIVTVDNSDTVSSLTLGAGSGRQTLWIKGNGRAGSVTLTVDNDIRNSGLIRLESEVAGYQSNLTILKGLLINTYVIDANVGSGGPRLITGQVLNRCRMGVQHDVTFKGIFTNRAILEIATGKQMSLSDSAQVFNQSGGQIGGDGLLALFNGATMNFNRGATTGANPPTLTNAKLNFGPAATGVATFIMQGNQPTSRLSGDIGADQTVWIRGNGQPGSANITALNGFINAGIIRLESRVAGYESDLTIANGVLTNTGIINVNQGTGGPRIISGTLVNQGAVNVSSNTTFKGTFSNLATLTIDSARTMSFLNNTDVFNQNAGTIAGKGILELRNGATMNFNSGATTGAAPTLTNAKLNFGPSAIGIATFIMQGNQPTSQLSGDIGAEQTVWIRGNGQPGSANITAPNGFTNAGVIRLESQVAGYESDLTIANGVLANTGVINVNQGTGGPRIISGTLVNQGAVNVSSNTTFKGTFSNLATLTIDSARTISFLNNTDVFNQNAGTIAGKGVLELKDGATLNFNSGATTGATPILTNAKLNFGTSATGVATFIMQGNQPTSQLSGDIGAEQTVWIRGNGQPGSANITALNGFTNAGVIRLESQVAGYESNLTIANGDTLTNTGAIDANPGTGGNRVITGQVDNQGSLNVNHDLRINGTFITDGILGIGLGPANNEFDQLQVSGSATLGGTLNLNVAPGFNPPFNTAYQILTCSSRTDTFATVNGRDLGPGKRFRVIYNPTNVTLQVAPEEAIAGLTATNTSPTPFDSVTTLRVTITAGSNVSYVWDFGDGTTGNGRVVTHTYAAAGNYTAIVTATNTLGSATDTTVVNIFIVPIAGLTATNNSPTPLDSVTTLTASVAAGSRVNYTWDFGDGTTGNGRVITHTYAEAGNYAAIVTATNAANSATDTTIVNIFIVPIAGLIASNNSPTPLDSATTFTATVTAGSRVSYTWNFGDGATGTGRVVTHTYAAAGNYTAIVMAANAVSTLTDTSNVIITPRTSVEESENGMPTAFMLSQNYPNPFLSGAKSRTAGNPSTTIRYAIPKAVDVTVKVYNLAGNEIETLVSEKQPAGEHAIRWNPVGLPSGIYFYRLQAGEFTATRKLVLVR
jgi:PKD repeat protein